MEQPRSTNSNDSDATPGGASWVFLIAAALTLAVLGLAVSQLVMHGSWPPFATDKAHLPSIGETGDFFGGWANSVALVWLIAVAWLQYVAIRIQQEELRDTRAELRNQAVAMQQQADHTSAVYELQKGQAARSYQRETELILRDRLREACRSATISAPRDIPEEYDFYDLAELLGKKLDAQINHTQMSIESRRGMINRIVAHTKEIVLIFDQSDGLASRLGDNDLREFFLDRRAKSKLYDRCKMFQDWAKERLPPPSKEA